MRWRERSDHSAFAKALSIVDPVRFSLCEIRVYACLDNCVSNRENTAST